MANEFSTPPQYIPTAETVVEDQATNESTLALGGISRVVGSETFNMNSARLSLEKTQIDRDTKTYDPLAAVRAHMSQDLQYAIPQDKKGPKGKPLLNASEEDMLKANEDAAKSVEATNIFQEFSGQTHNLRSEKISIYDLKIHDLYDHFEGYYFENRDYLEDQLGSTPNMSHKQRAAIRKAANEVHHLVKKRNAEIKKLRNISIGR